MASHKINYPWDDDNPLWLPAGFVSQKDTTEEAGQRYVEALW